MLAGEKFFEIWGQIALDPQSPFWQTPARLGFLCTGCAEAMNTTTESSRWRRWVWVLLGPMLLGCAGWQQSAAQWNEAVSNAQHLLDPAQGPITTQGREIERHLQR